MYKKSPLAFVLSVVVMMLVQAPLAQADMFDIQPTEVCAKTPAQLSQSSALQSVAGSFGGINGLARNWKLGGMAGMVAKVDVRLRFDAAGFYVKVNDGQVRSVWLCVDSTAPGVLRMHVQQSRVPELGLMLATPGNPGESLKVASKKSGWKFMTFKHAELGDE